MGVQWVSDVHPIDTWVSDRSCTETIAHPSDIDLTTIWQAKACRVHIIECDLRPLPVQWAVLSRGQSCPLTLTLIPILVNANPGSCKPTMAATVTVILYGSNTRHVSVSPRANTHTSDVELTHTNTDLTPITT